MMKYVTGKYAALSANKKERIRVWIQLAVIIVMFAFLAAGFYDRLLITRYDVPVPEACGVYDYKIVLLADLHNYRFGAGQAELIAAVQDENPDIIVLCGDIINRKDTALRNIESLLDGLTPLAPVYAVAGNHEMDNVTLFPQLTALYAQKGVVYLDGTTVETQKDGQTLRLYGGQITSRDGKSWVRVDAPQPAADGLDILLYHFGSRFNAVSSLGYDLVLAGHTHAGLVRLLGKGLLDTDGLLFPRYDKGIFQENGCVMVLSGGLGGRGLPRFFNRRELVSVTLRTGD